MPGLRLLAVAASTGAALAAALGGPAQAATLPAAKGDVSVGLPGEYGGTSGGRVDARGNDPGRLLDRADFGLLPELADPAFGTSVASGDLDGDGDLDLVVGAPGPAGSTTPGEVDVLYGSDTGFEADADALTPSQEAGDRVGAAVVLTHRRNEYGPLADLWVGAPGTDVGGRVDAGTVYHYTIDLDGEAGGNGDGRRPTITLADTITQDTTEVGGVVEAGDRFGSVLAPATNGVLVGVPDEDIGTGADVAVDAGSVQRIRVHVDSGGLLTGQNFSQSARGVFGLAETGDRFGAAVSAEGLLVGIPGEGIGPHQNAGMVQTFRSSAKVRSGIVPETVFTQNTKGVRGDVEAGDQFGASVAVGTFDCDQVVSAAVGVPGEDIRDEANAGTVEMFTLPTSKARCGSRGLHQSHGLPGTAEPGDRTGSSLTTMNGEPGEARHDTLVIGVPGEDVGAATDTGRVITWRQGRARAVFGLDGDPAGLGYGTVLGTEPS